MKSQVYFGVALLGMAVGMMGCEWTSTDSEGSWNDSYSWVDFSGLYRGSGGTLVRDFGTTSSGTVGTGTTDSGDFVVVNNEDGGTAPINATELNGILNNRPGIVPGSVTITLNPADPTGSSGSVTDNGSGQLSGTFNLVGIDPSTANPMNGTINYDTGVWTLSLGSPGLLTSAQIRANYTYNASEATVIDSGGGDGNTSLGIAGGDVNSMQVEQNGNTLTFRTSTGYTLEGYLSVVALPGGDSTGRSRGDVSATYEVNGDVGGQSVTISGTFSGAYVPPADVQFSQDDAPVLSGELSNRILQGIWMQPDGTADVYGVAPQLSVPVNVETTTDTTTTTE